MMSKKKKNKEKPTQTQIPQSLSFNRRHFPPPLVLSTFPNIHSSAWFSPQYGQKPLCERPFRSRHLRHQFFFFLGSFALYLVLFFFIFFCSCFVKSAKHFLINCKESKANDCFHGGRSATRLKSVFHSYKDVQSTQFPKTIPFFRFL